MRINRHAITDRHKGEALNLSLANKMVQSLKIHLSKRLWLELRSLGQGHTKRAKQMLDSLVAVLSHISYKSTDWSHRATRQMYMLVASPCTSSRDESYCDEWSHKPQNGRIQRPLVL